MSTIMKMKLEFEDKAEIVKRIAVVTSNLYYKKEKTPDMVKWVLDVLLTMHDNSGLSPYLAGVRNPFEDDEEGDLTLQEGDKTARAMKKATRRNTIFLPAFGGETKASIFYQRINSLVKSDDMKDLLNKEFEKLVDWFSKFSEK